MNETKTTVLLEHHLKALKLPTVLRDYVPVAAACSLDKADYATYLLRLTERELLDRERRAADRRLQAARLPVVKTLDTFDFTSQPSVNEALVRELMRGHYIADHENVLIVGNSGTGKTHLATALGLIACQQGRKVRFFTAAGLINQLTEAQASLRLSYLERSLAQMDLLIIDEIGYVPFSEKGAQLFFQVAAQSYERQSLIMTTNLDFSQWPQVFGSEQLTGALLDRLTHHAHILTMNGESFRFRESMSKKGG